MHKVLFICLFLFGSVGVQAESLAEPAFPGDYDLKAANTPIGAVLQQLAVIRSNRDTNVSYLSLALDRQEQVLGVTFETRTAANPPVVTADYYFSLTEIASANGVVLVTSGSYKAILLKGTIHGDSGEMLVSYLANGISGQYNSCRVKLEKSGGAWYLINAYNGRIVTDVFVRTYNLGIRTLENICP